MTKQNRALLSELVRTDFKLRYQGSALGYAWSLLSPLLMFAILYVVFVKFLRLGNGVPHYPIYLLLGIVIWNFFLEMTMQGTTAIVGRGDLIRKIRIPRWMIVFSTSLSALINLGLNLVVVAAFMIFNKVGFLDTLPLLIFPLFEVYVLALGMSLLLSALFVKYRDVSYIWQIILQAGFYITPIIYPLSLITNVTLQKLIMINPVAQAIQDARYAAITHATTTGSNVFGGGYYKYTPFLIVTAAFFGGLMYFKSQSKYFAENI
ncbi:MAG: ABC transporter permease [Patescibacteria group bacterium]|nr:ABC transporter permease [Patescibacteria group bacterium]